MRSAHAGSQAAMSQLKPQNPKTCRMDLTPEPLQVHVPASKHTSKPTPVLVKNGGRPHLCQEVEGCRCLRMRILVWVHRHAELSKARLDHACIEGGFQGLFKLCLSCADDAPPCRAPKARLDHA
eukprot:1161524-Pelagomonas_calceolata.AAC.7